MESHVRSEQVDVHASDDKAKEIVTGRKAKAKLKRTLPEGNHAVSYCCEAASQIKQEELPTENPFGDLLA